MKPNYYPIPTANTKTLIVYQNCGMTCVNDYEMGRDLPNPVGSPFHSEIQLAKLIDAYEKRGYSILYA